MNEISFLGYFVAHPYYIKPIKIFLGWASGLGIITNQSATPIKKTPCIMELIPFVCLFVCLSTLIKLLPMDMKHDILYTVGPRILWIRFLQYFPDRPDH